ncbi:hypothetical protein MXMO3_03450 (plasmid) [Maritalea myrionectae]|uniref:Uncharacterized protein n=1 Tax=Maritalea myrionectae TaxID=454601 RepID=A0A2R4MIZ9_9HYPH|nr:hypothetical protein [Maritalea myrionectae]AVX05953.1 hypothetical protein MXMO3_03450 [Maritalea myrionectae]
MTVKTKPRLRIGPEAEQLAQSANGELSSELLDERILELKEASSVKHPPLDTGSFKAEIQAINESLITIKTMIIALSANQSEEIKDALRHLNLRAQKHQTIAADLIGLDTPRLSNLQERLREFQQREHVVPEPEKEQSQEEKEL